MKECINCEYFCSVMCNSCRDQEYFATIKVKEIKQIRYDIMFAIGMSIFIAFLLIQNFFISFEIRKIKKENKMIIEKLLQTDIVTLKGMLQEFDKWDSKIITAEKNARVAKQLSWSLVYYIGQLSPQTRKRLERNLKDFEIVEFIVNDETYDY